ncbi:MAG: tyrosine-type recombinase/integrase [Porticoccus sp.]|nr:tyrosine-type recombinase/integrase [Porticoccus sp.]
MSTDSALLKALFEELSDFSFTDQLNRYEREDVSNAIYAEVDHIWDCMEDGCQPLHPDFSKDIAKLTPHQEPLKTVVPEGQGELYQLLFVLLKAHAANAANGRSDEFCGLLDRAKSIAVPVLPAHHEPDLQLFSELFKEFFAYKVKHENLSEKMQKGYQRNFETLKVIAPDKPINKITRKDIRDWMFAYAELPVRNKHPYKGKPVQELLDMDIPEGDLVKAKTVGEVVKMLQGVFRLALNNDYIQVSPAVDLNLKFLHVKNSYAPFTDSEVKAILEATQGEVQPYKRWIPLLAAYTGARRGELTQLRKQDFQKDDKSGRYYLSIVEEAGSVKNQQSIRRVPIHPELLEAGFIDYVNACESDRLFEVKAHRVTNWFFGLREKLGIEDCDQNNNKKVFHSFRHTVVTKMKAANLSDSLQKAVVGHAIADTSINQTVYTHPDVMPLSAFLPIIDALYYE